MNSRIKSALVAISVLLTMFIALPAEAAQSTSIIVEAPTYAKKNLSSEIQVHVCSGTSCASVKRSIALYVDGRKVKSWSSSAKTLRYSWKSSKVGNHKLQVKVSAKSGYKAKNSSSKTIKVKTSMVDTQALGWGSYSWCPSGDATGLCTEFPVFITPNDDEASKITIWLGSSDYQDNRKIVLQYGDPKTESWKTEDYGYASWDESAQEYYVNLQFNFDRDAWCGDLDGSEWDYRILIPATSTATETDGYNRNLHLRCNVPYPSSGNAVADFDYRDQVTDSAPSFWFYTQANSGVGVTLYVESCDLNANVDCADDSNWSHDSSDELTISSSDVGAWESLTVWDIAGEFLVRGVVVPSDGSTILKSDSYNVYNPTY